MATVFLTGRECPWRCVMCDCGDTRPSPTRRAGAIAAQIAAARAALHEQRRRRSPASSCTTPAASSIRAPCPTADYDGVAAALAGLSRVIVESHPALVGPRVDGWLAALARHRAAGRPAPQLEVAMGLETAHPDGARSTEQAVHADRLRARRRRRSRDRGVAAACLPADSPPFIPRASRTRWLLRSVDAAFACGASVVSLVPTRPGNGALEALTDGG